jgi:DNA-binding winged helix-turn-helix (wHTH) protein/tetratricopeptide (TPR) repeat protein
MQDNGYAGTYACGVHVISPATRRLERDGHKVDLEAKVFDLILLLVENRHRALDKREIVTALWGRRPVTDAALSQLVYKARRALDDDGGQQSAIRTVYGHGLQWIAPTVEIPAEPPREPRDTPAASTTTDMPAPTAPATPHPAPRHRQRVWWLAFGAAALVVLLSTWIIPRSFAPPAPPAPPPPRLAILPIQNATGNAALEWTARGLPGLIASLVGESPDLDVVDPLQVARVWGFTPTDDRSHDEHTRYVLNADILVSGKLRKLPGNLYELALHVDTGKARSGREILLTGGDPGALGIHAVSRIRHALNLERRPKGSPRSSPQDAYLAETFARGMDRAMNGDWPAAKPYFELVTKGEPDFLPGMLRLAVAQMNTNQPEEAQRTLDAVLDHATRRGDTAMAGRTALQIATFDLVKHDFAAALGHLQQAGTFADRTGNADLQAAIALKTASASARLQRTADAETALSHARTLIRDHGLHRLESDLHNSEVFLATARGDYAAAEQAGRAALAASTAIGNDHDALIDTYNLALNLNQRGHTDEALRLFARTWERSQKTNFTALAFASGDNLAIGLLNAGISDRAASIASQLQELGVKHDNRVWQALALMVRAGQEWYDGKPDAALASCRQAEALVDGSQDPTLLINLWASQASAALIADRASLPSLVRRADTLVAAQSQPQAFAYLHQLVHATAAAASGQRESTIAALEAAATAPPTDDPARDNLRYIGLAIALATNDDHAASIALAGYDPARGNNADVLRLYGQWARKRGDTHGLQLSTDRLTQLRRTALAALAEVPI